MKDVVSIAQKYHYHIVLFCICLNDYGGAYKLTYIYKNVFGTATL